MIRSLQSSVESGRVGFDGALAEYVEGTDNELSRAFRGVLEEMGGGTPRREALAHVVSRVNTSMFKMFIDALIRADTEGISLRKTLHGQYEIMRHGLWQLSVGSEFPDVLGPLAALQTDPTVRDIIIDAHDRVYVMRDDANYEWEDTDVTFDSAEALLSMIDIVFDNANQRLGPGKSVGEIRLPDGSHMIAVVPPTATDSPYVVIRKGMEAPSITWENLVGWGAITPQARDFLLDRLRDDVGGSILVTGNALSGKSAVARLLAKSIPEHRRVIVVASASDMRVDHPRRIYLETGGPDCLSVGDLLDVAAKLRPDWLVIPEVNGPEAFRAVQLMSGRYKAVTEVTALAPEEALSRLEALCLTANPGSGLGEIRTLIASAVNLVVHVQSHALPDYRRKITRIVEVRGIEHDRYVLQPLFAYDEERGELMPTRAYEAWEDDAARRATRG
jgi:pilus assembly protein CpaF